MDWSLVIVFLITSAFLADLCSPITSFHITVSIYSYFVYIHKYHLKGINLENFQRCQDMAWLCRVKFSKPEPKIFKKIHSPQYFILRPLSCPYVFIGARGIQENYQNWKKVAAEHIYMHFSKIVLKKGFGFVKVLARSGTWGARHNISDPEKNLLTPQGHSLDICGHQKKISRRRSRKNLKKIFKIFKKNPDVEFFKNRF